MKRWLVFLLAALCALQPLFGAAAAGTVVTAVVPSEHTVTVSCGRHGCVSAGGKAYTGTFTLTVPRLGSLTLTAYPDEGYALSHLTVQESAGVRVRGKTVTLTAVSEDKTISIGFALSPEDGDWAAALLQERYLGADGGADGLSVVVDELYQPWDYAFMPIPAKDASAAGTLLFGALPDGGGLPARRSLSLSVARLSRLGQNSQTLIFENGDAAVRLSLSDLLTGAVPKLIASVLSGERELTEDALAVSWNDQPEAELDFEACAGVQVEVRLTPAALADGETAYEAGVWLRRGDQELNVSALLPSMTVCLLPDDSLSEDDRADYLNAHAVALLDDADNASPLETVLARLPDETASETTERFTVTYAGKPPVPDVQYDMSASVRGFVRWALAASYAGEGRYRSLSLR